MKSKMLLDKTQSKELLYHKMNIGVANMIRWMMKVNKLRMVIYQGLNMQILFNKKQIETLREPVILIFRQLTLWTRWEIVLITRIIKKILVRRREGTLRIRINFRKIKFIQMKMKSKNHKIASGKISM